MEQGPSVELIRQKNDWLRSQLPLLPKPHRLQISEGCSAWTDDEIDEVLQLVKACKVEEGNNPYGENDFGKFEYKGETYYWKFDYTDANYEFHQVNGNRILTIMHCSEY